MSRSVAGVCSEWEWTWHEGAKKLVWALCVLCLQASGWRLTEVGSAHSGGGMCEWGHGTTLRNTTKNSERVPTLPLPRHQLCSNLCVSVNAALCDLIRLYSSAELTTVHNAVHWLTNKPVGTYTTTGCRSDCGSEQELQLPFHLRVAPVHHQNFHKFISLVFDPLFTGTCTSIKFLYVPLGKAASKQAKFVHSFYGVVNRDASLLVRSCSSFLEQSEWAQTSWTRSCFLTNRKRYVKEHLK